MHIPDGILSLPVAAGCYAASVAALAASARRARAGFDEGLVPLAGIAGAFIFAAQLINIPIPGGTSGHLMGGALLALLLGIAPAVLVMAAVLVVQCLIFQDGGLVALGANLLNMAVAGPVAGYLAFAAVGRVLKEKPARVAGAALAGWFSLEVGAIAAGVQLGLSGALPLGKAVTAMGGIHAIIGLIEAGVTAVVVEMLHRRRPDLLKGIQKTSDVKHRLPGPDTALLVLGIVSVALAVAVIHLASTAPDGLERVLENHGLREVPPFLDAPMPEYRFPWLSGWVATSLAGLFGLLGTFGLAMFVVRLLRRRSRPVDRVPSSDRTERT